MTEQNKILKFPQNRNINKSVDNNETNVDKKNVLSNEETQKILRDTVGTEINRDVPLRNEFIRMYPEENNESFSAQVFRAENALNVIESYLLERFSEIDDIFNKILEKDMLNEDASKDWGIYNKKVDDYDDNIIQLIEYITDRATINKPLKTVIHVIGGDSFLFREAELVFRERFLKEEKAEYDNADEIARININMLTDFIWNTRTERFITCCTLKDSVPFHFAIEQNVPKDDLIYERLYLRSWVTRTVMNGGSLLFRKYNKKNKNFSICGFICSKGKVKGLRTDKVRDAVCTEPDGSWAEIEDTDFYMAPLLFRNK